MSNNHNAKFSNLLTRLNIIKSTRSTCKFNTCTFVNQNDLYKKYLLGNVEKDKTEILVNTNRFNRMMSKISDLKLVEGMTFKVSYITCNKKTKDYIFLNNFEDRNLFNINDLRVSS